MYSKIGAIMSKSVLSIVIILTLSVFSSSVEGVKASNTGKTTNTRLSGQSASVFFEEGDRSLTLMVTRDEIANTTSLSFAYGFSDPNDPNLSIFSIGDAGEIPNSAFTIDSSSAQLTVTTPDSYSVTRCVFNNDIGEVTCGPTGPSTFDLSWTKDGSWVFEEDVTRIETSESRMVRTHGRFDQVKANVSGTWDEYSGANMTGFLTDSESATLLRENKLQSNQLFSILLTLQAPLEITPILMDTVKADEREAFTGLYDANGNLNGFVSVFRDGGVNNTILVGGYAFEDPNDPRRVYAYAGFGEIPNSAFIINSDSAQLKVTTPDSFTLTYCIFPDVIGNPGEANCYPPPSSLTFDLTWRKDGSGRLQETSRSILTEGSITTKFHGEYHYVNAPASGTWSDIYGHTGTNMIGSLANLQIVTLTKENP